MEDPCRTTSLVDITRLYMHSKSISQIGMRMVIRLYELVDALLSNTNHIDSGIGLGRLMHRFWSLVHSIWINKYIWIERTHVAIRF